MRLLEIKADVQVIELPPNYQDGPRSPPLLAPSPALSGSTIPATPPASAANPGAASSIETRSIGPNSIRSTTSGDLKPDIPVPYLELHHTDSRGSGVSEMTPDEIRARAEAALAEKGRPWSVGSAVTSPPLLPSLSPPILAPQRPQPTASPERRQSARMGPRVPSSPSAGQGAFLGPSGPRPPPRR